MKEFFKPGRVADDAMGFGIALVSNNIVAYVIGIGSSVVIASASVFNFQSSTLRLSTELRSVSDITNIRVKMEQDSRGSWDHGRSDFGSADHMHMDSSEDFAGATPCLG
ncbi:hypothetical protein BU17DRAFT_65771 [Hysterangium stoloniferum]|nr:hypothetical protein BU17DRAFT_65771 [Hysterangium stoloniferum]